MRKTGAAAISDLTEINPTEAPLRGLGQFPSELPFSFAWSNGSGPASATGAFAGLQHDGTNLAPTVGDGFSFTVPADTTERVLTLYTTAHWATGTLTATLSDGSAPTFSDQSVSSCVGCGNQPGVFTVHYAAGSAEQTLTVRWTESAGACGGVQPPYCDNVALYAAALSPAASVSGVTGDLSTETSSVPISGSNDTLIDIPLRAFEPAQTGTTPGSDQRPPDQRPADQRAPHQRAPDQRPADQRPAHQRPPDQRPADQRAPHQRPADQRAPDQRAPDQRVGRARRLGDACSPGRRSPASRCRRSRCSRCSHCRLRRRRSHLTLGELDLSSSALGRVTIGALALGSTPINGLGLPPTQLDRDAAPGVVPERRSPADAATSCTTATSARQSLFALGLAGAPINGLPINGLPMNGLPINGLPINGLPINGLEPVGVADQRPPDQRPADQRARDGRRPARKVDCSDAPRRSATPRPPARSGRARRSATSSPPPATARARCRDTLTLGDVIGLLIKRVGRPVGDALAAAALGVRHEPPDAAR